MPKRHSRDDKTSPERDIEYRRLLRFLMFFAAIIMVFFIGDVFNLAEFLNIRLRFDWAMIISSFVSAIAAITLAVISIEQNKQLAKINNEQLESSIIAQNYPMIKFCEKQVIKASSRYFTLKFFDIHSIPIKEVHIKNMALIPYAEKYDVDKDLAPIWIQKEEVVIKAEFTPYHEKNDESEGFYFADIDADIEAFQKYKYFRVEFELGAISTGGVVATYNYKLLIERGETLNLQKNRRYPKVYHQFYEFGDIMSAKKYAELKNRH